MFQDSHALVPLKQLQFALHQQPLVQHALNQVHHSPLLQDALTHTINVSQEFALQESVKLKVKSAALHYHATAFTLATTVSATSQKVFHVMYATTLTVLAINSVNVVLTTWHKVFAQSTLLIHVQLELVMLKY